LKNVTACILTALSIWPVSAVEPKKKPEPLIRIDEANLAFREIMAAPDRGIPRSLLERAVCVGIIPAMKRAGFVFGGQYGKGVLTCRTAQGWSGPSTIRMEGGSFGLQIGAGETDIVMVVMNRRGAEKLMTSEFTLGGEMAGMAGPVGRASEAKTDAFMHAQILSYSRSRGLFGGIALNGTTLRSDDHDNQILYGRKVEHKAILMGGVRAPSSARNLLATINYYSHPKPKKK
jgi:SH3 domain-containing YSC84-like protein 1